MTIVSIDKEEIRKLLGKISDKEIDDALGLFGAAVENITAKEVEVEITPNRPDMLSQQGILRALSSYTGKKTGLRGYKMHKPEKGYGVAVGKSVLDARPYTACAIVKKLKFDNSKIKEVIDIQEKLHATLGRNRKKAAIGIYPLEKIKLPIKYEARKPEDIRFMPLEAEKEMDGRQILSSHPAGREYAHLLADAAKFPVFADSAGEILSMPPIINSHKTGKITSETKEIFIECSGFDLDVLKKTLNILAAMFADMGGDVYQMNVRHPKGKYITPDFSPEKKKISLENCKKLLGLDLSEKEMKRCLEKMGYNYRKEEVEIPAWRTDIMHEVDIIEDIAVAYGYNNIKPELPSIATTGEISKIEILKKKISDVLTGLNMLEVSTYHLIAQENLKKLSVKGGLEVENSKSEYKILRQNLISNALKVLGENTNSEYPQRIFEFGRVFEKDKKEEAGILEKEKLIIALAENDSNFTKAKQILDYLMRALAVEYKIEPAEHPYFIDGRCGAVLINGSEIGCFGEVSPGILSNLRIKMPVCALEIDIEKIISS